MPNGAVPQGAASTAMPPGDRYVGPAGAAAQPPASEDARRYALAARIVAAKGLPAEIAGYAEALSTLGTAPRELLDEAGNLTAELSRFPSDRDTIAQRLSAMKAPRGRQEPEIFQHIARLSSLRDELRAMAAVAAAPNDPRAALYLDPLDTAHSGPRGAAEHVAAWIAQQRGADTEVAARLSGPLMAAAGTYVALWLAEQGANPPAGLTLSFAALENAVVHTARDLNPSDRAAFKLGARRIIAALVRSSQVRTNILASTRLAGDGGDAGAESFAAGVLAAGVPTTGAGTRRSSILSQGDLAKAIGPELFAAMQSFVAAIEGGTKAAPGIAALSHDDRQALALSFSELLVNYLRISIARHGKNFSPELLKTNGLEAAVVREAIIRARNEGRYPDAAIELLRAFFWEDVQGAQGDGPPPLAALRVRRTAPAAGEASSVRYDPLRDGGMANLVQNMEADGIPMGDDFRHYFEERTGYGYKRFLRWGEVREAPTGISERAWDVIVHKSSDLAATLRKYPPEGMMDDREIWQREVARAAAEGRLVPFALTHRPGAEMAISQVDWNLVISDATERGHPEDVTVEPQAADYLDSLAPAFFALREWARRYGRELDPADFAAAAFPVFRGIVRDAILASESGEGPVRIEIAVPSFMQELPFANWGAAAFARLFAIRHLRSDVHPWTRLGHMLGANPEYSTLRQYLAAAEGAGQPLEQRRELYRFTAGLMRWIFLFDSIFPHIYDPAGGRASPAPADIRSRFRINLRTSGAQFLPDDGSAERSISGAGAALSVQMEGERHAEILGLVAGYLSSLAAIPERLGLTLDRSPGGMSLAALVERARELKMEAVLRSTHLADKSAYSAGRSQADIEGAIRFYRAVREFAEDVLLVMKPHGQIPLAGPAGGDHNAGIPFVAAMRIEGMNRGPAGGNYPAGSNYAADGAALVFVDDIAAASSDGNWDAPRIEALLALRAILERARFEGAIRDPAIMDEAAIIAAAGAHWGDGDTERLAQAARDFIELEGRARWARFESGASVRRRGEPSPIAEPVIRRGAPPWDAQFRTLAAGEPHSIPAERIEAGIAALRAYFAIARGFYTRYDAAALSAEIEQRIPPPLRERTLAAANNLFARIGIASGTAAPAAIPTELPPIAEAEVIEQAISHYLLLGLDIAAPAREILIQIISWISSSSGRPLDSATVARLTDAAAENISAQATQRATPSSRPSIALSDLAGLAAARIVAAARIWNEAHSEGRVSPERVRSAYFRLTPALLAGLTPARGEIEAALASSPGGAARQTEADFLESFVARQGDDARWWHDAVDDTADGVANFFAARYIARGVGHKAIVTGEALAAVARRYLDERTLFALPSSIEALARGVIAEDVGRFRALEARAVAAIAAVVGDWLIAQGQRHAAAKGETLDWLAAMGDDADYAPSSEDEAWRDLANNSGAGAMAALEESDRGARLAGEMLGQPPGATLAEAVRDAYLGKMKPRRDAIEARRGRLEEDMDSSLGEAARLHARALVFSAAAFAPAVEPAEMDRTVAEAAIARVEEGAAILVGLRSEIAAIGAILARLDVLAIELEDDGRVAQALAARDAFEVLPARLAEEGRKLDAARAGLDRRIAKLAEIEKKKEIEIAGDAIARQAVQTAEEIASYTTAAGRAMETFRAILAEGEDTVARAAEIPTPSFDGFTASAESLDRAIAALKAADGPLAAAQGVIAEALRGNGNGRGPSTGRANGRGRAAKPPDDILRQLDAKIAEMGGEAKDDWRDARVRLGAAIAEALGASQAIADEACKIAPAIAAAEAAIAAMEARLPIGPLAGLKEPDPLPETDLIETGDGPIQFNRDRANQDFSAKARALFRPFQDAHLLDLGRMSLNISAKDANRVRNWIAGGKREALELTDIRSDDGRALVLEAGAMAVRIIRHRDLPAFHPFIRFAEVLPQAFVPFSREAFLLYCLASGSVSGEEAPLRSLLLDLLSQVARTEGPIGKDEAISLVRRWAVAHRAEIVGTIGEHARGFFSAPATRIPRIFESRYSMAEHRAMGRYYAALHDQPTALAVGLDVGSQTVILGIVTKEASDQASLYDYNALKIPMFDFRNDREVMFAPAKLGIPPEVPTKVLVLKKETPLDSWSNRTRLHIFNDPTLIELAALAREGDDRIAGFADHLLTPIVLAHDWERLPEDLKRAQEIAVDVWLNEVTGFNEFPELDLTQRHRILEVLTVITTGAEPMKGRLSAAMDTSLLFQRIVAAYRGLAPANVTPIEADKRMIMEAFKSLLNSFHQKRFFEDGTAPDPRQFNQWLKEQAVHVVEFYQRFRDAALRPKNAVLIGSRNWRYPLMVAPDPDLAARFPETGLVNPSVIHGTWVETSRLTPPQQDIAISATKIQMFQFPEYAGLLTIIGWATGMNLIPEVATDDKIRLTDELFKHPERLDVAQRLKEHLVEMYSANRPKIIEALSKRGGDGMTDAKRLTGLDEPWKGVPKSWDEVDPMERLRTLAPEYFAVRQEVVRHFTSKLISRSLFQEKETIQRFMTMHPELAGMVVIDAITQILPSAEQHVRDRNDGAIAQRIKDLLGVSEDRAESLRRIAEIHTSPQHLAYTRKVLAAPVGILGLILSSDPNYPTGKTLAEVLTGRKKPWLPEIAAAERPAAAAEEEAEDPLPLAELLDEEIPLETIRRRVRIMSEMVGAEAPSTGGRSAARSATNELKALLRMLCERGGLEINALGKLRDLLTTEDRMDEAFTHLVRLSYRRLILYRHLVFDALEAAKKSGGSGGPAGGPSGGPPAGPAADGEPSSGPPEGTPGNEASAEERAADADRVVARMAAIGAMRGAGAGKEADLAAAIVIQSANIGVQGNRQTGTVPGLPFSAWPGATMGAMRFVGAH